MAGGSFGSVIGVALGGVIAASFGWRWSFGAMAVFGPVAGRRCSGSDHRTPLAKYKVETSPRPGLAAGPARPLSSLFTNPAVICAYVGGGLQMFIAGCCSPGCPATSTAPTAWTRTARRWSRPLFVLLMARA